jgi:ribosomal protein L24E
MCYHDIFLNFFYFFFTSRQDGMMKVRKDRDFKIMRKNKIHSLPSAVKSNPRRIKSRRNKEKEPRKAASNPSPPGGQRCPWLLGIGKRPG